MILRGVERRSPRILIGVEAYQIDVLQRLRPVSYWKTMARMLEDTRVVEEKSKARAAGD